MYSMASPTVCIFSASSSGISIPNSSSNAMTSSTVSRESAPRSSTNEASPVTFSASTPNSLMIMSLTLDSMSAIADSPLEVLKRTRRPRPSAILLDDHPAVHYQYLPGNVSCRRSREKADDSRDIFRLAQPAQTDLSQQCLARRIGKARSHVRLDVARRERVHKDAARRELTRDRLGKPHEACLRRGVVRLA